MPEAKRAAASKPPPLKPPAPKRAAKKPAARKVPREEAAKAVEEIKNPDKSRIITWRGLKLTGPPALPASFVFDGMELEGESGVPLTGLRNLIVGVIGADQWKVVREKIAADGDPIDSVDSILEELIDAITDPYGMSMGKSSASPAS